MRSIIRYFTLLAGLLLVLRPASLSADLVKLKAGGEVRGKLRSELPDLKRPDPKKTDAKKTEKSEPVVVETLSGTVVAVLPEQVRFVTRRPLRVEEYETKAKRIPHTIEAHSRLAEWCRSKYLRDQRKEQLRLILDIAPDHEYARRSLGYSKRDGKWMTHDEWNRSRGLVKYKGRYITPEELDLIKKGEKELERERVWYQNVRLWKLWLSSRNLERRAKGVANLKKITDPDAVAALTHYFGKETDRGMRALFLSVLSNIKGPKPVEVLTALSLYDADKELRYAALNAISKDQYATAIPYYVKALRHDLVVVVRRAGEALRRVGDESAIRPLIEALTTEHIYKVRVPKKSVGVSTNGSFAGQTALPPQVEAMLRSGQFPNGVIVNNPQANQLSRSNTKVVRRKYTFNNPEVLRALQRITGQSFAYNQRDWRLWLASSKNKPGVKSP